MQNEQDHPDVAKRSVEEVLAWRKEHEIEVFGKDIPKPVTTFATSPFPGNCIVIM